jgi:hypothetical protein
MMPSWVIALAWLIIFKNDRIAGWQGMLPNDMIGLFIGYTVVRNRGTALPGALEGINAMLQIDKSPEEPGAGGPQTGSGVPEARLKENQHRVDLEPSHHHGKA